jgi:hypothetical protein
MSTKTGSQLVNASTWPAAYFVHSDGLAVWIMRILAVYRIQKIKVGMPTGKNILSLGIHTHQLIHPTHSK